MLDRSRSKILLLGWLSVFIVATLACSSQAAPPAPADSPSLDPEEVQALIGEAVEEAVKAAITESATGSGEEISRQELRDLMAEAIAETSPVASQGDLAKLVSEAIKQELAARPASISQADVERMIQREMAESQKAVEVTPKPPAEVGKPTIVFSDLRRQSAQIQNRIAMFIVQHGYGYPVDSISGETLVLWDKLLDGNSLVTMEIVLPNQQEAWDEAIIDGAVIPLGESLDANWQGFVVPTYLTYRSAIGHVRDISDEDYIDLFVAPGREFQLEKKAVFVNCPVGTECHDINLAKLKAYKLEEDVEIIVPASFAALQASLERAYLDQRSWLGYMWGPSRLSEELELTILREPDYNKGCWATTKGCAYPAAQVLVVVHPSMLSVAPEVVEFLRRWDFTARRQTGTEKWMNDNNATTEEAAIHFLNAWSSTWTRWVPESVAQRVQAAIAEEAVPAR